MDAWANEERDAIGNARELDITTYRGDGTPRAYVPIWVVREGDDLYVRSYRGRKGGWFRHGLRSHLGRIRTDGLERDVTFEEPSGSVHAALDRAYREKYGSNSYVDAMVAPASVAATFRIVPRRKGA
jgi:hypothetical protein